MAQWYSDAFHAAGPVAIPILTLLTCAALALFLLDRFRHRRARLSRQRNERHTRMLLDTLPCGVAEINRDGVYTYVNASFCRMTGRTGTEIVGLLHPWDIVRDGLSRQELPGIFDQLMTGSPHAHSYSTTLPAGDGQPHRYLIEWTRLSPGEGLSDSLISVCSDITEATLIQQQLSRSEHKYRQLVEIAEDGIWSIDADGITTFANHSMARILATTEEEMTGKSLFEFIPQTAIEAALRNLSRRRMGISEQHDFEFLRRDGTLVPTSLSVNPLFDADGHYTGALAIVTDISRRKEMEERLRRLTAELRESLDFIQMILRSDPNIIRIVDAGGKLILDNHAMKKPLPHSLSELIVEKTPSDRSEPLASSDRHVLESMEKLEFDELLNGQEGRRRWFHTVKTPLPLPNGHNGILSISVDITERKEAELIMGELNRLLAQRVTERTSALEHTVKQLDHEVKERRRLQQLLQEESERIQERLGQDLHDVLGQTLTAISLKSAILKQKLKSIGVEELPEVEKIAEFSGEAVQQMRGIAKMLTPVRLSVHGLKEALHDFGNFVERNFDAVCELEIDGEVTAKLSTETARSLFRISQEAIMNAIKHGRADHIRVTIGKENQQGVLSIVNHCREVPRTFNSSGGIGLMIMKNRAEMAGATLEIRTPENERVEVICRFRQPEPDRCPAVIVR